jgi:hypothetical protein
MILFNSSINFKTVIFFIWAIPLVQFFSFLSAGVPISDQIVIVDYTGYVFLLIFFFFFFFLKQNLISRIVPLVFLVFYSFIFDIGSISQRIGYILPFIVTIQSFWFLPTLKLSVFDYYKIQRNIYFCFYFIVICYLITLNEHFEGGRLYYDGFIIPHQFVYYLSIFSYFIASRKKYFLLFLPLLLVAFIGTRTGLILVVISIFAGLNFNFSYRLLVKYFLLLIFTVSICIVAINFFGNNIITTFFKSYSDIFDGINLSFDIQDTESVKITSGRNLLLLNGLSEVFNSNWMVNLIGRGPRSSYGFNDLYLGLDVWFHNDFMEVLFSFGLVNFLLYLFSILYFSVKMKSKYIFVFILFSAMVNGFYLYSAVVVLTVFVSSNYDHGEIDNSCSI